ncbi:DUF3644 domain-containing protein [Cellulomonas sp. PhB143]|uniref:DUF3644 domain-containing protein n=1 Tax=Cellulomonas sp. PhB143 TaxID=2485186 RepID=UPI000F4693E0|nr:DUF3644 domain-containing protein [Cellulomonas sp. PhB143]ROS75586.1 uncharacterized protein DUF3644 [Cellulomonas sp. PhB143]
MAPRPRWWHMLQASKNEARLAVDLYNRSGNERQLEAFVVHMNLAWLRLLQAATEKDDGDLFIRDARGWRVRHHEDGEWKHKPLSTLLKERFTEHDPVRRNVEFFMLIRNRIEHRYERDIASLVAGKTQALLLNYERAVVELFGAEEGVAQELRFPLFMSVLTDSAVEAAKRVRSRVPKAVLEWVQDFETGLQPDTLADQRFEFRVFLVPHKGPRTTADASISFIRMEDLTPEQTEALDQFQTIIQDKYVPVEDLGNLRPKDVVKQVGEQVNIEFTMHAHTQAWRYFGVRPPADSPTPEKTKSDFCRYNDAFGEYVYTPAWVNYLVRKVSEPQVFAKIMAWQPSSGAPSPTITRAHDADGEDDVDEAVIG